VTVVTSSSPVYSETMESPGDDGVTVVTTCDSRNFVSRRRWSDSRNDGEYTGDDGEYTEASPGDDAVTVVTTCDSRNFVVSSVLGDDGVSSVLSIVSWRR